MQKVESILEKTLGFTHQFTGVNKLKIKLEIKKVIWRSKPRCASPVFSVQEESCLNWF